MLFLLRILLPKAMFEEDHLLSENEIVYSKLLYSSRFVMEMKINQPYIHFETE